MQDHTKYHNSDSTQGMGPGLTDPVQASPDKGNE